jgi:hypothetical protein
MTESEAPSEPARPEEDIESVVSATVYSPAATRQSPNRDHLRSLTSKGKLITLAMVVVLAAVVLYVVRDTSPTKPLTPVAAVLAAETAGARPTSMAFGLYATVATTVGSSFQVVSEPLKFFGTGAVDRAAHSAKLNLTIKESTRALEISEVRSKDSVYAQFASLTPYLRSGKTWIEVPTGVLSSKYSIIRIEESPSPVPLIKKREIEVALDGHATVSGIAVALYRLTLDRTGVDAVESTMGAAGVSDTNDAITYVLAIDDQHIVRRIQMTLHETVLDTHLLEKITLNIAHYDESVVISKPPAELVEKLNSAQYAKLVKRAQTAPPSLV